jgi:hypothetical protein
MKKLRLNLAALTVDSFQTDDVGGGTGTVEGYVSTQCTGGFITCNDGNTCVPAGATCSQETCYVSCNRCPGDPNYETYDGCGDPIYSSPYTGCGNCEVSVNEVGTCIAPCTFQC